jgi:hypothetical protein
MATVIGTQFHPRPGLAVRTSAFYTNAQTREFDFNALVLTVVHEMRHMGTPNWGDGERNVSPQVRSAEHYLNELEDYDEMYRHPFFVSVPEREIPRLQGYFDSGRDISYMCFQATWGSSGGAMNNFRGYPDDTAMMGSPITPLGGGFGGMIMPVGVMSGVRPSMDFLDVPLAHIGECFNNGITGDGTCHVRQMARPAERCEVAHWATANRWMRSRMVRSAVPAFDSPRGWQGQPWNTLAHYNYGLPFRRAAYAPCVRQE